ncbi:MAG TPA: FKBP-type peptidyl-prolyl cis-trans isomerase, partial [Brachybacterium massiliense]|nr:FKBP-type peptidyl-prolyl cis-trans isomerase [Brachybacterium massiliense]
MTDRTKPEVDFPEGPAPTELLSTDEIVGDGEEAGRGDVVDVHYVGVSHSTGEQFDASWDRGEPLR